MHEGSIHVSVMFCALILLTPHFSCTSLFLFEAEMYHLVTGDIHPSARPQSYDILLQSHLATRIERSEIFIILFLSSYFFTNYERHRLA